MYILAQIRCIVRCPYIRPISVVLGGKVSCLERVSSVQECLIEGFSLYNILVISSLLRGSVVRAPNWNVRCPYHRPSGAQSGTGTERAGWDMQRRGRGLRHHRRKTVT